MTPTTEVRYGDPVEWRCRYVKGFGHYCDESCRLRVRFAYEECPEGCEGGQVLHTRDPCTSPCIRCSDSDLWNIPKGTVRVRCPHGSVQIPGSTQMECNEHDCPNREAGRCYDGYAVEVAP